jgi:hypothetical protein
MPTASPAPVSTTVTDLTAVRTAPVQPRVEIGEATTSTSATAAPEPAPPAPAPDAEQLFHQLYPRVRDELRWELLVQRERIGLLSDPL